MSERSDLEIRQEARFALWALRVFNAEELVPEQRHLFLARGFDLADARHALPAFVQFGETLTRATQRRILWHGPHCGCLSAGELLVLQALAQCQCGGAGAPAWAAWQPLIGAVVAREVECVAREWLLALGREGIHFPTLAELVEGLAPLENLLSFQTLAIVRH